MKKIFVLMMALLAALSFFGQTIKLLKQQIWNTEDLIITPDLPDELSDTVNYPKKNNNVNPSLIHRHSGDSVK